MFLKWKKCPNCDTYHDPTLEKCPECHKHNELYLNRELPTSVAFLDPIAQIGLFLAGFAYAGMLISEIIASSFLQSIADEILRKTLLITVAYLTMFFGLGAIVLLTRRKHFFKKYTRGLDYIYGAGYALSLVFASLILSSIISIFITPGDNTNQSEAIKIANNYPIIAFFILALLGPICEELTYRVGLYSFLRRINKWMALGVTALVFAFIHFSFDGDMVNELISLPSYIVSGLILTYAYEHRGPACSMTAHILYNIFAFAMMFVPR